MDMDNQSGAALPVDAPPHCAGTRRDGVPCRAKPRRDSAYCRAHTPTPEDRDAGTPGEGQAVHRRRWTPPEDRPDPDIRKVARMLDFANEQLLELLEANGRDAASVARVLATVGQNASRIARLLRDQRAISDQAADDVAGAFARILDEITGSATER